MLLEIKDFIKNNAHNDIMNQGTIHKHLYGGCKQFLSHKFFTPPPPDLKGCGMGPWLVLVSPCFREKVVATCKIGSFLCSLDNLLQKNVIVLFFGNQISKWRSLEKRAIFDLLFTFFSHQGNVFSTYLTHIHDVFCSPY